MNKKKTYITPQMEVINIGTQENIAQFVVTSQSIGEDAGEAKSFIGFEEDNEQGKAGNDSWWDE